MDLVIADASGTDLRIVDDFTLDMAFGSDENSFSLTLAPELAPPAGGYAYVDGTEYGGTVDSIESVVQDGRCVGVTCKGRTWHGILAGKVLTSGSGSTPLSVSGTVGSILGSIIGQCGLSSQFSAASGGSQISWTFERFQDAYSGICAMLQASGMKLKMVRDSGKTVLSAEAMADYTDKVDSDLMDFSVDRTYRRTNHLVCAGEGQDGERNVVHIYADSKGNISQTQTLTGVDEVAALYDYSSADAGKLLAEGKKKLGDLQGEGSVDASAHDDAVLDIGDMVSACDRSTGLQVTAQVTKKMLRVKAGIATYSYELGTTAQGTSASLGGSGGSSSGGLAYTAGDGISISGGTISAVVTQDKLDAVSKAATEAAKAASDASATAGGAKQVADTAVQKVTATAPIVATTSGTSVSLSHKASGVTSGSYGPAAASSPAWGGTVTVPSVTIDSTGHVTAAASRTVTLPSSAATSKAAGLMSAADKSKLDGIASGADVSPVKSVQGRTGAVTVTKADVGLGDADNTADSAKSVASAARLTTARTITLAGAVTGSASFDGSKSITITTTGQQAAASFLAAHPVGSYFETSDGSYDPSANGGTWEKAPSLGPYKWHRTA
ncbi:MAG: hypothetical protein SO057_02355 [Atopobiaceae bacterium]|nr:hypothetical protein [Atopobiaceae bacterium]